MASADLAAVDDWLAELDLEGGAVVATVDGSDLELLAVYASNVVVADIST